MNVGRIWRRWRTTRDGWRPRDGRLARHHGPPIRPQRLAAVGVAVVMAASVAAGAGPAAVSANQVNASQVGGAQYQATIVRTAYGVPHITADNFGSLGYGYGFALASDQICSMAQIYVTVEGQRSRYFGPNASVPEPAGGQASNLDSDIFWQSVIDRRVIPHLLAVRTGVGAVEPRVRQLMTGYVAGYNHYLASVGGSGGVPNPVCRGRAWVKPITLLDAYLVAYQTADVEGLTSSPDALANAQPPTTANTATANTSTTNNSTAKTSTATTTGASSATPSDLTALAASVVRTPLGTNDLPSQPELRALRQQATEGTGSNAIAIGSAGMRDHRSGLLLGNPHIPWLGALHLYQVQFTIPGTMDVEGATIIGVPVVVIGFTGTMAWSETTSRSWTNTLYQLTLVPGHPTEYVYNGKAVAMTSQTVTVRTGRNHASIRHTVWFSRYGAIIDHYMPLNTPWTTKTAFALADADAGNLRLLNQFLGIDEAGSAAQVLSVLKKYEGVPWNNTVVADAAGHALYADIMPVPDVTNAQAARCDTAVGVGTFAQDDLPVLDGSKPSCGWRTGPGAAAPGIFGGGQEPALMRRDFVENSNDSFWLANPGHPLTGFPRIFGDTGKRWGAEPIDQNYDLRTRSALTLVMDRIAGTDGLGRAGFTLKAMKNLMYSDIQYGASLVKPQVVAMCRSFPGGLAPTSSGKTIPVGDACNVLAAWNGRENPWSRGAVLFSDFWNLALGVRGGPWSHPFQVSDPVHTPYGLDAAKLSVQRKFGDALKEMDHLHQPYDVALGQVQYVLLDGHRFRMPGGQADPNGEINAMEINYPGAIPGTTSTYIQAVTWSRRGPQAATVLTYSESDNPSSPHYDDQTGLFAHRQWATAYFSPAQVAAHAVSSMTVSTDG